jgi:hypothetical protein
VVAHDLLWLDGSDLRSLPLVERNAQLERARAGGLVATDPTNRRTCNEHIFSVISSEQLVPPYECPDNRNRKRYQADRSG